MNNKMGESHARKCGPERRWKRNKRDSIEVEYDLRNGWNSK